MTHGPIIWFVYGKKVTLYRTQRKLPDQGSETKGTKYNNEHVPHDNVIRRTS